GRASSTAAPLEQLREGLGYRGRRRRVLVGGEALKDVGGRLVEAGGEARARERARVLLHLAHEAPRLSRVVADRALRARGQIGLREGPLRKERLVHALG